MQTQTGPVKQKQIDRVKLARARLYGTPAVQNVAAVIMLEHVLKEKKETVEKLRIKQEIARFTANKLGRHWLIFIRREMADFKEKQALEAAKRKEIKIRSIVKIAAHVFGEDICDMRGPQRHRELAMARWAASFVAVRKYRKTFSGVGRALNRDHATIIHSVKKAEENLDGRNETFALRVEEIQARVKRL